MKQLKYEEKCNIQKLMLFSPKHVEMLNFLIKVKEEAGAEIVRDLIEKEFNLLKK